MAENLNPKEVKVSEFMSKHLISARPKDDLKKAAGLMKKHSIRRLAIVENDKLVGILTATDIAKHVTGEVRILARSPYRIGRPFLVEPTSSS